MSINDDLNKSQKGLKCVKCGRKHPEVTLNIEGSIHHGCELKCLDTKSCNRIVRKIKYKERQLVRKRLGLN